ncbi:MAG: serine--tRNA ligase [Pseudolabrys sp.]
MYDIKWIRENPAAFDGGLKRRGLEPLSGKLLALDEKRRAAITQFEQAQARRNAASKEIGEAKKAKDEAKASALMAEVAKLKDTLPQLEKEQKELAETLQNMLAEIPNMPLDDVPDGKDEHGNVERHTSGTKRSYAFAPKQHFELGEALGMMDFELAAKLSGARFVVLQKGLARMERALGQFMLDVHTGEHGYTEVNPPLLVRDDVMFGTAQLPKFEADQFFVDRVGKIEVESYAEALRDFSDDKKLAATAKATGDKRVIELFELYLACKNYEPQDENDAPPGELYVRLYFVEFAKALLAYHKKVPARLGLIPTAEVPLTNLVREAITDEAQLPLRLTACTPCFRAEAGAAGKDTRGMIRQHQFTKVELVSITTPEKSKEEHERMLSCAEAVLKKLDLHYRVITLCTGDMGFASQKTYDIEVWLPGQNMYREISSCSICGDFQAQRMKARYKGKDGKVKGFVHTLNGSGVAVGRALIAVMETYQQDNGAIAVPEALKPYMGGITTIEKKK